MASRLGTTYAWVAGITQVIDGKTVMTAWGALLQLVFAVLLLALGVVVAIQGIHKLLAKKEEETPQAV